MYSRDSHTLFNCCERSRLQESSFQKVSFPRLSLVSLMIFLQRTFMVFFSVFRFYYYSILRKLSFVRLPLWEGAFLFSSLTDGFLPCEGRWRSTFAFSLPQRSDDKPLTSLEDNAPHMKEFLLKQESESELEKMANIYFPFLLFSRPVLALFCFLLSSCTYSFLCLPLIRVAGSFCLRLGASPDRSMQHDLTTTLTRC